MSNRRNLFGRSTRLSPLRLKPLYISFSPASVIVSTPTSQFKIVEGNRVKVIIGKRDKPVA
jgi:hypothetical protein